MSAKRRSPRATSPAAKQAKIATATARCADCEEWQRRADEAAEREAALTSKEAELQEREVATSVGEEALAKRREQLALAEKKLVELKAELERRAAVVERESERVKAPSVVRQQARRAKIEERMRLAVTLNRLPREAPASGDVETVKAALSRMGKSYQDLNEGNGFLAAGELYGDVERFLGLFDASEKLTNVTPVARLLDVIKNCKWRVTSESDESAEERAKTMMHAFQHRVHDRPTMARVQAWLKDRNLQALTEDDIAALLYLELPDEPDESDEARSTSAATAARFKPPAALPSVPDKLALRDEKLRKKMQLADDYDEALDKELFCHQHGRYNVLIGRALRTVCDAYQSRAGGMGRLDGSRFFFGLFPAGQSGKRKRADLSTVEEAAVLIAALGEELVNGFAGLVDMPEQMEDVCRLARDAVELQTASIKRDATDAVASLKRLLVELEQGKRHASVRNFIKRYASDEVPMRKDPRAALALLEKHIGDPILDAFFELSRVDLGETPDYQGKLKQALKRFHETVELVYESDDAAVLRPRERDAYVIASMLLWKRRREVNKVSGAAELMAGTYSTLGAILGKPGRRFPVWDPETGSEEHLFTWNS